MPVERKHGTRAKYVGDKCRCDECRGANRAYYHSRQRLVRAAAAAIPKGTQRKTVTKHVPWLGKAIKFRKTVCKGVRGTPCPHERYLKRNSIGGVCSDCRDKLLKRVMLSASPARKHLAYLSERGVGLHAVNKTCKVAYSTLQDIKNRKVTKVSPRVLVRIMNVTTEDMAPSALVPAEKAWELVRLLKELGVPKATISEKLGNNGKALQIGRTRVLKRTLEDLQLIYEQELEAHKLEKKAKELCDTCGMSHAKPSRFEVVKRMLPNETSVIVEAYTCIYGIKKATEQTGKSAGYRMLIRDLNEMGAEVLLKGRDGGSVWGFPE
jgi:ferredoxin-fold anticodon binding domain-containing protein